MTRPNVIIVLCSAPHKRALQISLSVTLQPVGTLTSLGASILKRRQTCLVSFQPLVDVSECVFRCLSFLTKTSSPCSFSEQNQAPSCKATPRKTSVDVGNIQAVQWAPVSGR